MTEDGTTAVLQAVASAVTTSSSKPTDVPSTSITTTTTITNNKSIDPYSLQIKSDYVLKERASTLPPLSSEHTSILQIDSNNIHSNDGNDSRNNNNNNKHKKKGSYQNKKEQRKKRPRDDRIDSGDKICLATLRGDICPYGTKCRFGHDMKAYLATRQDDIKEIGLRCPFYDTTGYCPYGVLCRIGTCHLNMATGENIIQSKDVVSTPVPITNILSKDVQFQLRKNTYPFQCKRHYEKSEKNKQKELIQQQQKVNDNVVVNTSTTTTSGTSTSTNENDKQGTENVIPDTGPPCMDNDAVLTEQQPPVSNEDETPNADATVPAVKDDVGPNVIDTPALVVAPTTTTTTVIDANTNIGTSNGTSSNSASMDPLPSRTKKIVDFSNKVYVAPLTTVGNLPFRRIMKDYGADITCGEMALAQGILEGKASEWALLKRHSCEDIFGVQIAAGFPDMYTRTMELIENHTDVDFVDLNLGCPLDLVCDKGSGAALMLRDNRLKECLKGICSTLSCPITIKMRTGWDEKKPIAYNLVQKIASWELSDNVAAIMIHGRSRLQRYSKEADWDYIRTVAMTAQQNTTTTDNHRVIPVIGNGDIMNYTDYEKNVVAYATTDEAKGKFSTCAMLARGALIKPWLPTEIKERRHWDISSTERMDILKTFVKYGLENWGTDQQGINNCRRFLLEWLSFLHRYVPVGILEYTSNNGPQQMNQRPPPYMCGRNDLETLFLSNQSCDWIKISEMLLGPVPDGFKFEPKHKANSYAKTAALSSSRAQIVASW